MAGGTTFAPGGVCWVTIGTRTGAAGVLSLSDCRSKKQERVRKGIVRTKKTFAWQLRRSKKVGQAKGPQKSCLKKGLVLLLARVEHNGLRRHELGRRVKLQQERKGEGEE